ncbi:TonB-dependent receptor [Algiphilus sp.]|uniref:TonB-dependent receptor n=1 Tax=Algiphilus sp. TaxID=1872431 RepID=UPI003B52B069
MAWGASTDEADAVTPLQDVIVTGHGDADGLAPTEVDLHSYTGFSRSVERGAFADRYTQMGELLDALPGVQVNSLGGVGAFNRVALRGSTGEQVNIYLDGLLLNSPQNGGADFNPLPPALIERIVVYPDFTPLQLGDANLAGAIDFRTRNIPAGEASAVLRGSYGSFGTRYGEASLWGSLGGWRLIAAASHTHADNDFPVEAHLFRTESARRQNDGFDQHSLFLKATRRWSGLRLQAQMQHSDSDKELPTSLNQRSDTASLGQRNTRGQARLDYALGDVDVGHHLMLSHNDEVFDDPESDVGLGSNRIATELWRLGAFNAAGVQWGSHRLVLGLDWREDRLQQDDRLEDERQVDARRQTVVLGVSNEWTPLHDWIFSGLLRQTWVDDRLDRFRATEQPGDGEAATTAQLGLKWWITPLLQGKANAGWLVRIPTLDEKFGARGLFEGAPELEPEKALSADAGVEFQFAQWNGSATVFARKTRDTIVTIFNSRGIGQPQNIGEALRVGVAADLRWTPRPWMEWRAGTTLLSTENQSRIRSARGKQLPGLYHRRYDVGLSLHHAWLRWSLDYRHSGDLFYDPANGVRADDKDEISTSITTEWRALTLDLTLRNLLDENFLDINRFPTPGRSVLATLSYTIQ